MISKRTNAREVAMQLLFERDLHNGASREDVVRYVRHQLNDEVMEKFTLSLYDGTLQQRTTIDDELARAAENWSVYRMAPVDRNILRLGAYELLNPGEVHAKMILDEVVYLARRYGTAESAAFVNGVLDRFNKDHPRPEPAPKPEVVAEPEGA